VFLGLQLKDLEENAGKKKEKKKEKKKSTKLSACHLDKTKCVRIVFVTENGHPLRSPKELANKLVWLK